MILDQINKDKALVRDLDRYFDFKIESISTLLDRWNLKCHQEVRVFGSDAGGGLFGVVGQGDICQLPVLYLSSEGESGIIANSLKDFFELIVFLPAWRDAIFCETESEIVKRANEGEQDMTEMLEGLPIKKQKISGLLSLNGDLVIKKLNDSIKKAESVEVWGDNGENFGSLFEY
ncbi:hypothetical protein [Aliikangiella sp. G2MR2-5]|uniref:hypothetical protein n=1 Tax=Aliikangiella sp. G2MR2-5 TaxID=2788943 RepID=UPI0018A96839|nr:hypothetical protein [Aliikangiella sp. G2MR2-5]